MVPSAKHLGKICRFHEKTTENKSHAKHRFRFPRILTVKNRTNSKSEEPIRFAIKFTTKAVKTPYLYANSIKSYERKTVCSVFNTFLCLGQSPKRQVLPIWFLRSYRSPELGDGFRLQTFLKKLFFP